MKGGEKMNEYELDLHELIHIHDALVLLEKHINFNGETGRQEECWEEDYEFTHFLLEKIEKIIKKKEYKEILSDGDVPF